MAARRGGRRRRRRTPSETSTQELNQPSAVDPVADEARGGTSKAAIALALLLGLLLERIVADILPTEALDIFHLAVIVGIAFFVARWYRRYMRRALARRRESQR